MSTIKDYQTLILVVPAIAGGIYQIYMILSILGFSYLRYFSVAQVIPDGLIALFFFGMLFIIYSSISYLSKVLVVSGNISDEFKIKVLLPAMCFFVFSALWLLWRTDISEYSSITKFFGDLFILLAVYLSFTLSLYLFIEFFYDVFATAGELQDVVISTFRYCIYILLFIIVFIDVPGAFKELNSEINENSNFYNFEKLATTVQNKYKLNGQPKHVYANKDYIFYPVNHNEKTHFIAVDTKELTVFESDDKKD